MYKYDKIDQQIVNERVAQYRDQTRRYLGGELTDEEFRPLRLQNGLYIQRHAPMLRIAVPYGLMSSTQLRKLGEIAKRYDRGYGHFSTRQNLQLNWPKLEDVPEILAALATVEMHAIQTSGNCIRNITTDQFAGIAPDEIIDPRAIAEIMRQWSTFHPEFALLPRKFKIAVSGTTQDRAIVQAHDIGLEFYKDAQNQMAIKVWVGGGLGRTPILGTVIREHLEWQHALSYCEAVIRVYNIHGRRDNAYKARIKILVKALGIEEFRRQVDEEWTHLKEGALTITQAELDRVAQYFEPMPYETLPAHDASFDTAVASNPAFAAWAKRCVHGHRVPGYRAVTISLKPHGKAPGDITSEQMQVVADLADAYSFGELRSSHEQNLILADVKLSDLFAVWEKARAADLATPNIGLLTDIICCPGGDFCSLANAKSIPIAEAIQMQFDNLDYLYEIGDIELNISGCMNACGHHHVGHIGILGVDKDGSEWYQVTVGGKQGNDASIGSAIGPSFSAEEMPGVVQRLIEVYLQQRSDEERFIDTVRRIGVAPFKAHVYAEQKEGASAS
ncbi:nitrite/sulfite reductase [Methylophilus aquaticus]|uniref:Nitrite/sulfite reductase n=1 Tax=Methylophilus aquaticus TaxID=1971610 RepID=A0ABT9JSZ3_9PROT|nr:nitrite/sulfite reductase [Methylophilus aquaticus]MDP8567703.1 nitrite/sulfite reductase [Methylophilus aquaticus]